MTENEEVQDEAVTLVLTARIPEAGIARFQAYEAGVLPLLADHGGHLQRRLRNGAGTLEVHIVLFRSRADLLSFRHDPGRAALAHLLAASGAIIELVEVRDVA